jgi:hypothetical protein
MMFAAAKPTAGTITRPRIDNTGRVCDDAAMLFSHSDTSGYWWLR